MKNKEMVVPPAEYIAGEMGELVEAVATYNNSGFAIGYNVFYYVSQMKNDENIALLSVDGVTPSKNTIKDGTYPFINDFYVTIRKDTPEGSPQRILYEWIQSSKGQQLIDAEGYVAYR